MRFEEYTIALLVSGSIPMSDALQDAHLAHLASLHEEGSLLAAGPLSDPTHEAIPAGAMSFSRTFFPRSMDDVGDG